MLHAIETIVARHGAYKPKDCAHEINRHVAQRLIVFLNTPSEIDIPRDIPIAQDQTLEQLFAHFIASANGLDPADKDIINLAGNLVALAAAFVTARETILAIGGDVGRDQARQARAEVIVNNIAKRMCRR